MSTFAVDGLASGLDTTSIIEQLMGNSPSVVWKRGGRTSRRGSRLGKISTSV